MQAELTCSCLCYLCSLWANRWPNTRGRFCGQLPVDEHLLTNHWTKTRVYKYMSANTCGRILTDICPHEYSPTGFQKAFAPFQVSAAALTINCGKVGPGGFKFLVTTAVVTRNSIPLGPSHFQFLVTVAAVTRNRRKPGPRRFKFRVPRPWCL